MNTIKHICGPDKTLRPLNLTFDVSHLQYDGFFTLMDFLQMFVYM